MSHEHLRKAGIREGNPITYELLRVTPAGVTHTSERHTVEKFTGGGFFGSVILLSDSIIKTTQPDPLHELLRDINWPVPFPSRASETAAQLDTIAGSVLHAIVPAVTEGLVSTPQAEGYTRLPSPLGYAQVIERMHGRGPVFGDGGRENAAIDRARRQIWELHTLIGAEHTGQVHVKNPFGKQNLWIGEKGRIIWLDYLPAFRHTGYLRPFFYYPFHQDLRQGFDSDTPTYNRIHTDLVRDTLKRYGNRIPAAERREATDQLDLYDRLWQKHAAWTHEDPRELFVTDALSRGIIGPKEGEKLRSSLLSYDLYRTRQLVRLGLRAFLDTVKDSPLKIFWDREFLHKATKFALNPEYRRTQILQHSTLWGMNQAREHGLITDGEYAQALSFVPEHELRIYVGLQLWFLLNSRLIDAATVPFLAAAASSPHPVEAMSAVGALNILTPGIVRALSTVIAGRMSRVNLQRATLISAIPIAGNYLSIPLQLKEAYGQEAAAVEHYALRGMVAALSKLSPGGGWGSDLEEKIWNKLR